MTVGKPTAVVYDLDSTLAHTRHRWHLSPMTDPSSSWEIYSGACLDDSPLAGTIARLRLDWYHHEVHICSGRGAAAQKQTDQWLLKHVGPFYDYLTLRPVGDETPNGTLKVNYIKGVQMAGTDVVLAYEDWPDAARQIYEETGVPVLGVNPFYEEDDSKATFVSDGIGGGL